MNKLTDYCCIFGVCFRFFFYFETKNNYPHHQHSIHTSKKKKKTIHSFWCHCEIFFFVIQSRFLSDKDNSKDTDDDDHHRNISVI